MPPLKFEVLVSMGIEWYRVINHNWPKKILTMIRVGQEYTKSLQNQHFVLAWFPKTGKTTNLLGMRSDWWRKCIFYPNISAIGKVRLIHFFTASLPPCHMPR